MTRIGRIYADFLLPAAKVFRPRRHEDTKSAEPKMVPWWLCVFVANLPHHAEGEAKSAFIRFICVIRAAFVIAFVTKEHPLR